MLFVPSGLSAVLDLAIMPVGLLVIGAVLGEDRLDRRRMAAIGMGPAGLMLLFGPQAIGAATGAPGELAGALAILASSVAYAWARYSRARCCAPFSRRRWLARQWRVVALRWSCLPWRSSTVLRTPCAGPWDTKAWLGWLFLVLFGSLVGYTTYLRLLGEWRPVREGSYAFVSPLSPCSSASWCCTNASTYRTGLESRPCSRARGCACRLPN